MRQNHDVETKADAADSVTLGILKRHSQSNREISLHFNLTSSLPWAGLSNGVPRDLVFDLTLTHERFGDTDDLHKMHKLRHPADINKPLREAARGKSCEVPVGLRE